METEAHGLLSMPGVGFFGMLIIGLLAGYIAGTFVGGSLASLLGLQYDGWLGNLLVASVSAILLLWVWPRFRETA